VLEPKETPSEPTKMRHRSPQRRATGAHGKAPSEPKETRHPGILHGENALRWGCIRKVYAVVDVLPRFLSTYSDDTLAVLPRISPLAREP
jgi:hypothetical protein